MPAKGAGKEGSRRRVLKTWDQLLSVLVCTALTAGEDYLSCRTLGPSTGMTVPDSTGVRLHAISQTESLTKVTKWIAIVWHKTLR